MNVRLLCESDAELYRELRLSSLINNPDAFLSTYEMEVDKPLESIVERLKSSNDRFTLGAFNSDGVLGGIVTFVRESNVKTRHKGNVFGMYVDLKFRGQGIGRLLMKELIERAKQFDGLEQINLTVVSSNVAAKQLYKSMGFEVYGTERNSLKYGAKYFDEEYMVFKIR